MNRPALAHYWRHGLLVLVILAPLFFVFTRPPFGQDLRFHDFADQRSFLGIPNFLDVSSNLPFLTVGVAGLWLSRRGRFGEASVGWTFFMGGVALVSIGSAYYHWQPCNATLLWDRLPMTIAFMAMSTALLETNR